jgi:hypothetical protein
MSTERKLKEAGYCDCEIDYCELHTAEHLAYREAFEAMRGALRYLLLHHRITSLDGVSDTLQPRLDAARAALALAERASK